MNPLCIFCSGLELFSLQNCANFTNPRYKTSLAVCVSDDMVFHKKENNAAAQLSNEMSFLVAANAIPVSLPIGDDVIIPPGWCWGATNNTVNTDIGLQFDYFEEPTA